MTIKEAFKAFSKTTKGVPTQDVVESAKKGDFSINQVESVDQSIARETSDQVETEAVKEETQAVVAEETKAVEGVVETEAKEEQKVGIGRTDIEFEPNLNVNNIQTTDDIIELLDVTSQANDNFVGARRGVVSNEQTLSEADNYTIEELLGRKPGDAFNAAQITQSRKILLDSAANLREMADKILRGEATEAEMLQFRQMGATHVAIQHQVSGMTAEAGRALQAFKINVSGGADIDAKSMMDAFELSGGRDGAMSMAMMIRDSKSLKDLNKATRDTYFARTSDMFMEVWINAILSGPQTHMVNITSNGLVTLQSILERTLGATSGTVRSILTGEEVTDRVYFEEVMGQMFGLLRGMQDGLTLAGKTAKTGETQFDDVGKVEQRRYQSITAENVDNLITKWGGSGVKKDSFMAQGIDLFGELIRTPTERGLQAEDAFFKILNYRMELNALAYRTARQEGFKGAKLQKRVEELIAKPTEQIHMGAVDFARQMTFTNELGATGKNIQQAVNRHPVLKVMIPFMRTIVNLQKYFVHRTPLGLLPNVATHIDTEIKAGGARKDMALGKLAYGTMLTMYALNLAYQGKITGQGHKWRGVRDADYRQGWQPYSYYDKEDNTYTNLSRLDPTTSFFTIVADAYEIAQMGTFDDASEAASAVILAIYHNLSDKSYTKGISDFQEAMSAQGGSTKRIENWVNNLVASAMPYSSMQSTIVRGVDPVMRDAQNTLEKIKKRIPGLSEDLPCKQNIYGECVRLDSELSERVFLPWRTQELQPTYEDNEIRQNEVNIQMPDRYLGSGRFKVELDTEQYHDFVLFAGSGLRQDLQILMMGDEYQNATTGPDGGRAALIRGVVRDHRGSCRVGKMGEMVCTGAHDMLMEKYPQLRDEYDNILQVKKITKEGTF